MSLLQTYIGTFLLFWNIDCYLLIQVFIFFLLDASPIACLSPVELGVEPVKRFGQTDGADRPGS